MENRLIREVRQAVSKRDLFRAALTTIANINNGPDRASGEWRCQEAAKIAQDALNSATATAHQSVLAS